MFHMIKILYWIGSFLIHSSLENETSLKLVNVVFRHGDRTPVPSVEFYPKDPHVNLTFGNQNHSVLTESGKYRTFKLGKFLKSTYSKFLDKNYTPGIIVAQSTDVNRTKESLNFVLKGLYPNVSIPTIINPRFNDSLLLPQLCRKYIVDCLGIENTPSFMEETLELKDFMKNLSNLTGKNIRTVNNIHFIYSTLENEKFLNLTLPSWTHGIFPDGYLLKGPELQYKLLNYDDNLKKQTGGMLIRKFIDDMTSVKNGSKDKKLLLYSAHDITVVAVLKALGVYFSHVPKFSSAVILELHQIRGDYFVKIVYYLGVPEEKVDLKIPNCKILCPLDEFVRLMENVLPLRENFFCPELEMRENDEIHVKYLPKLIKLLNITFT